MRIVVSSGVRWIGHEQKCFRFEVLGCLIREGASGSFVPDISFSSAPLPSGFLSARWSDPAVVIAGNGDRGHTDNFAQKTGERFEF